MLDKVRVGRLAPETIAVRLTLSDMSVPVALPAGAETRADGILDQVRELADLGLVRSATAEVRQYRGTPP